MNLEKSKTGKTGAKNVRNLSHTPSVTFCNITRYLQGLDKTATTPPFMVCVEYCDNMHYTSVMDGSQWRPYVKFQYNMLVS